MSFRFTVSLFEADQDAGSPDAADITAILRKSEREPVVLSSLTMDMRVSAIFLNFASETGPSRCPLK